MSLENYSYSLATGRGTSEAILNGNNDAKKVAEVGQKKIEVREIPIHIVRNAIARNPFFSFKSIKRYFPHIQSVCQFIKEKDYLGGLVITFQGDSSELFILSNQAQLDSMTGLLKQIESELCKNTTEYKGTETFRLKNVNSVFTDKSIKLNEESERADGDEQFVSGKDWYVFNANYGN